MISRGRSPGSTGAPTEWKKSQSSLRIERRPSTTASDEAVREATTSDDLDAPTATPQSETPPAFEKFTSRSRLNLSLPALDLAFTPPPALATPPAGEATSEGGLSPTLASPMVVTQDIHGNETELIASSPPSGRSRKHPKLDISGDQEPKISPRASKRGLPNSSSNRDKKREVDRLIASDTGSSGVGSVGVSPRSLSPRKNRPNASPRETPQDHETLHERDDTQSPEVSPSVSRRPRKPLDHDIGSGGVALAHTKSGRRRSRSISEKSSDSAEDGTRDKDKTKRNRKSPGQSVTSPRSLSSSSTRGISSSSKRRDKASLDGDPHTPRERGESPTPRGRAESSPSQSEKLSLGGVSSREKTSLGGTHSPSRANSLSPRASPTHSPRDHVESPHRRSKRSSRGSSPSRGGSGTTSHDKSLEASLESPRETIGGSGELNQTIPPQPPPQVVIAEPQPSPSPPVEDPPPDVEISDLSS